MIIIAARRYVSPRYHALSDAEARTRAIAYALKRPSADIAIFEEAAREMARLINTPCWLVPIPNSQGDPAANNILALQIAKWAPGAVLVSAIRRTRPIQSQCERHRHDLPPIPAEEHNLVSTGEKLGFRQVYFVDNVATSGNTLRAAFEALGNRGAGLVYAAAGQLHDLLARTDPSQPPLL